MCESPQPAVIRASVAIFSSRESIDTLSSSVYAALAAAAGPAVVDVIVNGNRSLADEIGRRIQSSAGVGNTSQRVRVWHVAVANKAHAWNLYTHEIWPCAEIAYFIDGYVQVRSDAFSKIADGLKTRPDALAASGVPTVGRSAKQLREAMLRAGWIHGNCYALRGVVMKQFRARGFRLPLGIYYGDALIASGVCFDLDPSANRWCGERILVHPEVTWTIRPLAWWHVSDLQSHCRKMMRQAHGVLENRALRWALGVRKSRLESLPGAISDLILEWLQACPGAARAVFFRNPLCILAARKLSCPQDWSQTVAASPVLVSQVDLSCTPAGR